MTTGTTRTTSVVLEPSMGTLLHALYKGCPSYAGSTCTTSVDLKPSIGTLFHRLLRSAAQRALRSERRSQKWERERERRSLKKMGARAALSKKAER